MAFLSDYNIFTMNVDGTGLTQITKDNTEKRDLQWSPDGSSLFFLSGKCVHYVTQADGKDTTLACFTSSSYLESFEISPDGSQVAITLDRVLYIVPFELEALAKVRNWTNLRDMPGRCLSYGSGISSESSQPLVKNVRWSGDGERIAANTFAVTQTLQRVDLILVFDVFKCDSSIISWLDNFPGSRFSMVGFEKTPVIPFFSWDGG